MVARVAPFNVAPGRPVGQHKGPVRGWHKGQVADDDVIHPDETINDLCARFNKSREYLTELALEEEHRAIGKGVANTI
jgi:hypothetical protein